jgi:Holliday junction resolvase
MNSLFPKRLTRKKKKRISKNTAYKRGRNFEYRVKKHFEKKGYYVIRKYASQGAEDLVALKVIYLNDHSAVYVTECLLIQCKNLKVEKNLSKVDATRLKSLAKQVGGTPLLAKNVNHKLKIEEVI